MMTSTPDELWQAWLEAVSSSRPVLAKATATTLLDVLIEGHVEPRWKTEERRAFLIWCEAEGLLVQGS